MSLVISAVCEVCTNNHSGALMSLAKAIVANKNVTIKAPSDWIDLIGIHPLLHTENLSSAPEQ
jgi:hypothetical protein